MALSKKERALPRTCRKCGVVMMRDNCYLSYWRRGSRTCKTCADKYRTAYRAADPRGFNESVKRSKAKLKSEVITAYGEKCTCCGESEPRFLTVDHINGRGTEDKHCGESLYRELRRSGFPKDNFQILCWNCNSTKGIFGACPHTRISLVELAESGKKLEFSATGTPTMVEA